MAKNQESCPSATYCTPHLHQIIKNLKGFSFIIKLAFGYCTERLFSFKYWTKVPSVLFIIMSRLKYYNPKMLKSLKWGSQLPWHLANADYKTVALIKHALMEVKMLQVTFAGKNNRWGSPLIHSSSVTSLLTVTSSVFRCVMLRPPTFEAPCTFSLDFTVIWENEGTGARKARLTLDSMLLCAA